MSSKQDFNGFVHLSDHVGRRGPIVRKKSLTPDFLGNWKTCMIKAEIFQGLGFGLAEKSPAFSNMSPSLRPVYHMSHESQILSTKRMGTIS